MKDPQDPRVIYNPSCFSRWIHIRCSRQMPKVALMSASMMESQFRLSMIYDHPLKRGIIVSPFDRLLPLFHITFLFLLATLQLPVPSISLSRFLWPSVFIISPPSFQSGVPQVSSAFLRFCGKETFQTRLSTQFQHRLTCRVFLPLQCSGVGSWSGPVSGSSKQSCVSMTVFHKMKVIFPEFTICRCEAHQP